jgi:hypothetical protein
MPDYRLTPKREGYSDKVTSLDHLAYRVWQQYKASADDYGVMPDEPSVIRAGNRRLQREPEKAIRACLDQMLAIGLVHRFVDQNQPYVYSRVWQDHQKIRYPSETFYPVPPTEQLEECSDKTRVLFEQRFGKSSETDPEKLTNNNPPPTRAHSRNAIANANADRFVRRAHPLDEAPDRSVDPDTCERAARFETVFAALHSDLTKARYVGNHDRDWPHALRLATQFTDREFEALLRVYLVATGPHFDGKPRTLGRLAESAPMIEQQMRKDGRWPNAA